MDERPRYDQKWPFDPDAGYRMDPTPRRRVGPWEVLGWMIVSAICLFVITVGLEIVSVWKP